jgi:hypothetical protein
MTRMKPLESSSYSFIVRIWYEEPDSPAAAALRRAQITNVADGQRRGVETMGDIREFITPYLTNLGVKFRLSDRLRRWLRHRS